MKSLYMPNIIETVQRKFTKRLPLMCAFRIYRARLTKLNLQSLALRRLHLDLIFVYKISFRFVGGVATDFRCTRK